MSGLVVVDASLAFKWLVKEEHSDEALAIAQYWNSQDVTPTAPHLMPVEVANALYKRVARGELTVEAAKRRINSLISSGIELREALELHGRTLELAHELHQGGRLRCTLSSPVGGPRLRSVDRGREVLPGGEPNGRKRTVDRRVRTAYQFRPTALVRNSMNGPALRQESA